MEMWSFAYQFDKNLQEKKGSFVIIGKNKGFFIYEQALNKVSQLFSQVEKHTKKS